MRQPEHHSTRFTCFYTSFANKIQALVPKITTLNTETRDFKGCLILLFDSPSMLRSSEQGRDDHSPGSIKIWICHPRPPLPKSSDPSPVEVSEEECQPMISFLLFCSNAPTAAPLVTIVKSLNAQLHTCGKLQSPSMQTLFLLLIRHFQQVD